MEQITKREGNYYYGKERCRDIEDAYSRYREDYHRLLGREVHGRLDRLGQRAERIHGFGFVFEKGCEPSPPEIPEAEHKRIPVYILGLVGIHYFRTVGCWDYGFVPEELFDQWFDWVFTRGRGRYRTVGTRDKVGRTSKRLKKRYR